jgi:hypothetical protein
VRPNRLLNAGDEALGMFTDRTEINQRPSFADELEALQPQIRQAIEDQKNSGISQVREWKGLRKPEEVDEE